jgi:hypothetical protein
LSENKTNQTSNSRSAAPQATALLILGYLASVFWFFFSLIGALATMDHGVETPDSLVLSSAFYLMLALVIIADTARKPTPSGVGGSA